MRAVQRAVPVDEPIIGDDRFDYADCFEIRADEPDDRSVEDFVQLALRHGSRVVLGVVGLTHRYVLRTAHPSHNDGTRRVMGWAVHSAEHDVLALHARSPLVGRAMLVARRTDPTTARLTTYLFFSRPVLARTVWTLVGPLHRRVAPYLLDVAAKQARIESSTSNVYATT